MSAAEELEPLTEVAYRKPRPEDLPFVYSGWLESYARESPLTFRIPKPAFFEGHHKKIDQLFERPVKLMLACLAEDTSVLFGFALAEQVPAGLCLHYLYVKKNARGHGIAKGLLRSIGMEANNNLCSHITYDALGITKNKNLNFYFNPYLL